MLFGVFFFMCLLVWFIIVFIYGLWYIGYFVIVGVVCLMVCCGCVWLVMV